MINFSSLVYFVDFLFSFQTKETFEFTKNQYFVFHMNERLPAGQYSLHFEYEAQLAGDLKGLYKSTYKRKSGKTV